jgi:hypothetical protein
MIISVYGTGAETAKPTLKIAVAVPWAVPGSLPDAQANAVHAATLDISSDVKMEFWLAENELIPESPEGVSVTVAPTLPAFAAKDAAGVWEAE